MARESSDFDIPEAVAAPKRGWSPQLVWLIPIVAVLAGGWLAAKAILERGPTITISFKTAEGLEAGKTKIKYKDVDVGEVKTISFTKDLSRIIVTAEMAKGAAPHLVEDTRFWVVRPRVGAGGISGLGTLFSGSYIGVDVGKSTTLREDFEGLEVPPIITGDVPGRQFVLRSQDIGSLDVGDPVFYRRFQVGRVVASELDKDGMGVTLKVFVNAPYDQYVTPETRFWHASGIDLTLDAGGFKLTTQSLSTLVLGGVAFEVRADAPASSPANANAVFTLFKDHTQAMRLPDTKSSIYTLVFDESLRGLEVGAPVDFRGLVVGEVAGIGVSIDPVEKTIRMRAEVNLHINRVEMSAGSAAEFAKLPSDRKSRADLLVANGMRAQIKTGSLLTGQLYVALDFFPDARPATVNWKVDPPEFPTTPGGFQELQTMLHRVAARLDKVPIDKIGTDLHQTLQSFDKLAKRLDSEITPEARLTLEEARKTLGTAERTFRSDAPLQQDTRETLRELSRTAQSLRVLADYLERHPESLIRGKKDNKQ